MSSRRDILRRLILAPAGAGLALLAAASLAGCEDHSESTNKPPMGSRDDPKAQKDMEIPPGIAGGNAKAQAKGNRP